MAGEAEAGAGRYGRRVVLLGAPGSGKGTQAAFLAAALGVPVISTGEMLRDAVAAGSELGRRVEGVMAAGALVADDLMGEVVESRLSQDDARAGFILDGYPRTTAQAATLDEVLARSGAALDRVLLFDVPEGELVRRALGRGRSDDKEEVIRERFLLYREKTQPLVALYRERSLLAVVNGFQPVGQVTADLLAALEAR
ncbi:MAG: adenylate kinase [Thermoanaerobaculia bacterium]|nr:adenylate kinase [Thermoanaerobaculia bacterium]